MDQAKVNERFAVTFADQLAASGVEHVCLAPGSRSAPLAMAFARHPRLRTWVMIDERSCAFFALGLAKATERPVALLCTSGTAAAELHPAVVEADLSRTPLVVLTADRPPELVGVGANQAIDQDRIYGGSVRWYFDPGPPEAGPEAARRWRRLALRAVAQAQGAPPGPVHLNLPFREPLVPPPGELSAPEGAPGAQAGVALRGSGLAIDAIRVIRAALSEARRPLVVAGELRNGRVARASAELLKLPIFAEPTSQLRLRDLPYDAILREPRWAESHRPDVVIRIGGVPTSRPLNDWLAASGARTFVVDPHGGWRDPDALAELMTEESPDVFLRHIRGIGAPDPAWAEALEDAGRLASRALDRALEAADLFEGHVVRALSRTAPADVQLLIGSSMPIRDVDTFWQVGERRQHFLANRGASGIDGLVSTGLGIAAADPGQPTVLLLGDLSLYHDMNGLWAIRRHGLRATVVVLDNDGGGIFSFLPQAAHTDVFEEVFGTPLGLRLEDVARLHGLDFAGVDRKEALDAALAGAIASPRSTLVAVRFSRRASVAGHRACWAAVSEALSRAARPPAPGA